MGEHSKIVIVVALLASLSGLAKAGASDKSRDEDQACMDRNFSLRDELKEEVDANSKCEMDSDCQVISVTACPLGCYVAVTKKSAEKVRAVVKDLKSRLDPVCQCMYKCSGLPRSASCVKGRCSIEGRR
jgi:hypothetical protein